MDDPIYNVPATPVWPVSGGTATESKFVRTRTCLEKQNLYPGYILATVSFLDLLPPVTLDLSTTGLTLFSKTQVTVREGFTFVIMDNGMVFSLCHPHIRQATAVGPKLTAIMSLYNLLLLFGCPSGEAKVISPFQTKVVEIIWAIRESKIWRASNKEVYPHLEAYRVYLLLLVCLSTTPSINARLLTDESGKPAMFGKGVDGTVDGLTICGT